MMMMTMMIKRVAVAGAVALILAFFFKHFLFFSLSFPFFVYLLTSTFSNPSAFAAALI
jgi:hypothetical protein